jgi:hypothetical protein
LTGGCGPRGDEEREGFSAKGEERGGVDCSHRLEGVGGFEQVVYAAGVLGMQGWIERCETAYLGVWSEKHVEYERPH